MNTTIETEIVIIGAGIAGCIAAMALAPSHQVVLIDKLDTPLDRIGECLPAAASRILKKLKLLDDFEKTIHKSQYEQSNQNLHLINKGTQSYWGSDEVFIVDPLCNPDGFGWHLNRKDFESFLRKSVEKSGVHCVWPAKFQNSTYNNKKWTVNVKLTDNLLQSDTYTFISQFVIDATGRQSHFARSQGIIRSYFDKLITCWFTMTNVESNKMSIISSSSSGWWYSAPLPGNKRVVAFQTDADLIDRSITKKIALFLDFAKTNQAISEILDEKNIEIQFHGTVAANSSKLDKVVGNQWVALGDAAISFDPLSSQGMFNAMANAMQLSELILASNIVKDYSELKSNMFQTIYTEQINKVWQNYLFHKSVFYNQEKRFKEQEFWSRRHSL